MPKPTSTDLSLENEIAQLRELLKNATADLSTDLTLEEKLAVLDTVARAAPRLAQVLKTQRDLAVEDLDPAELLRQALRELEEDWPELHDCKERLRSGGVDPSAEG